MTELMSFDKGMVDLINGWESAKERGAKITNNRIRGVGNKALSDVTELLPIIRDSFSNNSPATLQAEKGSSLSTFNL